MSEENCQQNVLQNQIDSEGGSESIQQDRGILDGTVDDNKNQQNKKRFDLLGSTYEDGIWNSNLDGNNGDNNIPKAYPGKKWRNARVIVLTANIIMSLCGVLTYGLEILTTVLLIIFLALWIKTARQPENQEIIKERNMGKRMKGVIGLYVVFTVIAVIYDITLIRNFEYTIDDVRNSIENLNSYDPDFYYYSKTFTDEEIIKVANEYVGCNCFGNNATQDTRDGFTSKEFESIVKKVSFNRAIEGFLYKFEQDAEFGGIVERHEEEIRKELIDSANTIVGKKCFGSYTEACDLQSVNLEDLWKKTYMDALNKVSPKVDNGEWK